MLLSPLFLLACAGSSDFQVQASLSDIVPTVLSVTWTGEQEVDRATLYVETSEGELFEVDATDGSATAWGLPPGLEVDFWLAFDSDGDVVESDVSTVTTGSPESGMPSLSAEGDSDRAFDGALALTTSVTSPGSAVLIDGQGRYRWWAHVSEGGHVGRARLSVDGEHILSMPVNNGPDETDPLVRFALDGSVVEEVLVEGQHHDFLELSDGTLVFLVKEYGDYEGVQVPGDRLVEVAPDGTQTEIWNAWDWLDPSTEPSSLPDGEWTHANALGFDEAEQAYYVNFLGLQALFKIDRASGDILWKMGTDDSDFERSDGDLTILQGSHQFEFLEGSLLAFENGPPTAQDSRAVELSFDVDEPVMQELWSWSADPAMYTYSLGDVERLASGDTVVDFSANGVMVQVDSEGAEQWRLSAELGGAFGYLQLLDDLHRR